MLKNQYKYYMKKYTIQVMNLKIQLKAWLVLFQFTFMSTFKHNGESHKLVLNQNNLDQFTIFTHNYTRSLYSWLTQNRKIISNIFTIISNAKHKNVYLTSDCNITAAINIYFLLHSKKYESNKDFITFLKCSHTLNIFIFCFPCFIAK